MKKCLMEIDRIPDLSWEEKLAYLTHHFLQRTQVSCPVKHIFRPGVYIRQMRIPAETLFVGRPHTYGHRVDLVEGKVLLITESLRLVKTAPDSMLTIAGQQVVFFSMSDVVGRTFHANPDEIRDTDKLEAIHFGAIEDILALGEKVTIKLDGKPYRPRLFYMEELE